MAKRKSRFVKLYVKDDCSEWIWARPTPSKDEVTLKFEMDRKLLSEARRGRPFKCLIALGAMEAAKRDPRLFPHPVKGAYVLGTRLHIITTVSPKNAREHPTTVEYPHNLSRIVHQFDELPRRQFIQRYAGQLVTAKLGSLSETRRNNERRTPAKAQQSRSQPQQKVGQRRLIGAAQRAAAAGLIHKNTLYGGPRPEG